MQKHLCELLMWNASHVHKHFSKAWQDWFFMIGREKQYEGNLSTSLLEGSSGSDAAQNFIVDHILFQIATTVQKWNEKRIDLPVLGLAGCHWYENWFCRYVTRRPWWYPRIIWGASLDGASYVLSIPLLYKGCCNGNDDWEKTEPQDMQIQIK